MLPYKLNMKISYQLFALIFLAAMYIGCSEDGTSPVNPTSQTSGGSTTGSGGSLARFTIANDYLYIATDNQLYSYSLSNAAQPEYTGAIPLFGGVETIFAMGDHLFLGTQNGVLIYNISNAAAPQFVSNYVHITSCDPVVVKGVHAYATLRTGQQCWRGTNQLDVINISTISNPYNEKTIDLENPIGLGIYQNYLFICDNDKIKCFDISTPGSPSYKSQTPLLGCYDVILKNNTLLAVHSSGVSQYSISPAGVLTLLSTIN